MRLDVRPRYLVAGRTHPKVLATDGEAYRNARIEQAWRNGVAASVSFDADYRDVPTLTALIQSSAIVVLPYDSRDQATSGVLVDAIAAGRPVVATAFPHAVELLASGAGIVVDHDDPDALALALRRVLTEPGLAAAHGRGGVPVGPQPRLARGCLRVRGPGRAAPGRSPGAGVTSVRTPFEHLVRMTDDRGTFEHARLSHPRPEHGYCTDDMARVLVVATREHPPTPTVRRLAEISLTFLTGAQGEDGDYRNRMDRLGRWEDRPTTEDCWGRSIWGLGTAAARSDLDWVRQAATAQLERAARQRSVWPRAMAFAALGAAEVLAVRPDHGAARALLADAADSLPVPRDDAGWPWPEARLAYANAALPEAMIAAGVALDRPGLLQRGLDLLAWLLDHETRDGHLSVTPVGGAGPADVRPAFDQQPIEVAALADACARAAAIDGHPRWADGLAASVAWFDGDNDAGAVMWDPETAGGYDGLQPGGPNLNQGAESTLALLSTRQQARRPVGACADGGTG